VDYRNVKKNPSLMKEFLEVSGGQRDVPLIIDGSRVSVGYGGS
jgi:hypothetical protein